MALRMTNRASIGVALWTGAVVFALVLPEASAAFDSESVSARSAASTTVMPFLPLEVAEIQREADYTRDENAYHIHTTGLVALGIGLTLILGWLFGVDLALRLRGDPLPRRVRVRLDRLDTVRLGVLAAVRACKRHKQDFELTAEKRAYEQLSSASDDLLDKMRRDLRLNFVDEVYLVSELDELIDRSRTLTYELRRLAPVPQKEDPVAAGFLYRINRGWERVFSSSSTKFTTIQQLLSMRWPSWSSLESAKP